jgi:hypothetical protein
MRFPVKPHRGLVNFVFIASASGRQIAYLLVAPGYMTLAPQSDGRLSLAVVAPINDPAFSFLLSKWLPRLAFLE